MKVAGDSYSGGLTLPGEPTESEVSVDSVPDALDLTSGDALVSTEYSGATITSYPTEVGSQTFIEISDASSASEYGFELELPQGATASVENDGAVAIRESRGDLLSGYDAPWAVDANGETVPTSFRIEGDTLVQTVDISATDAFPVIADPSDLWGWAHCIGVVGVEVLPFFIPGGKFAAAGVKLIAKFGSLTKAIKVMKRAWNTYHDWGKFISFLKKKYGNIFVDLLGISALKAACFT